MMIIRRYNGLKVASALCLALALSACGGDSEDSSFEKVGEPSDAPTNPNTNLPPSQRNVPMIPGIRIPTATEPSLRNNDGSLYPRVASLTSPQQPAPAFVAALSAHDIDSRVLTIAGQRIAYDDATLFIDRPANTMQAGHVVHIHAVPLNANLWHASQVRFIAEALTPGATQLTLSSRVQPASANSHELILGSTRVAFVDTIPALLATPGAWVTMHGYDTGNEVFTASTAQAFGLNAARAGDAVLVSGPAYLDADSSTLFVAGIRVRFVTDVNIEALQLGTLAAGEWITVAGVIDGSVSFILGTALQR